MTPEQLLELMIDWITVGFEYLYNPLSPRYKLQMVNYWIGKASAIIWLMSDLQACPDEYLTAVESFRLLQDQSVEYSYSQFPEF